jgi:rare lipoprotein A (peptidoglycan hydrolase)
MYIKNTQQCANFRSSRLAIKKPARSALRNHIVVVLCSLWVIAPAWAVEDSPDAVPLAVTENGPMAIANKPVEAIKYVTSTAVASVNSVALAVASAGSVASRTVLDAAGVIQHGVASWYGERFQNKRTANGERFNMNALTAAHPTLPFGTKLCAHSPATGKSVIVRINDRGPFAKDRIIDFSKAAAQALGILHSRPGVVALLDSSDERCEKG